MTADRETTGASPRRSTLTRTVAATTARTQIRAQRLALDLAERLPLLDDEWVVALARVVMTEVHIREQRNGATP